jgi:hypothetical protein
VVKDGYQDFFTAAAGVAGALIGLLFVTLSVAREPVVGPSASPRQQVRAATALVALLSALLIALIALIPGVNIGYPCAVYGGGGLVFTAASVRRLVTHQRSWGRRLQPAREMFGFAVVMGLDVWAGVRLIRSPHSSGAVDYVAGAMIGSLAIGIDRAWGLVGARHGGIGVSVLDLLGVGVSAPVEGPKAKGTESEDG